MRPSLYRLPGLSRAGVCAPLSAFTTPSRCLSTLELEDEETQWRRRNEVQYGEGNYPLFRALYKELCDEVRREFFTKPPPPFTAHLVDGTRSAESEHTRNAATDKSEMNPAEDLNKPEPVYGDGSWRVTYHPENNTLVYCRDAVKEKRMARVVAYARVAVQDPPRLNAMLTFADWYPFEVLIERKGVVVHLSVACNEGGMHMRNCRVYDAEALALFAEKETTTTTAAAAADNGAPSSLSSAPKADREGEHANSDEASSKPLRDDMVNVEAVVGTTDDAEWVRQNLLYDGPCLWHLELGFQNELYDVMQDHGIDLDWLRWASEWVFYMEHFLYTRWCLGMLENLIPSAARGAEEDFLLPAEQALLDEPAEDWLAPHAL